MSMSRSRPRSLTFITSNKNKLAEVRAILSQETHPSSSPSPSIELDSRAVDVPEIQGSVEEIAREKCRRAAEVVQGPVLTEDTALELRALNGLPGPYIKHFLNAIGNTGLITLLSGFEDKSATAICTFAYCTGPRQEVWLFQGRTRGKIVEPRGEARFGYDPIFEYEGKTYAEMGSEAKNRISHRFRALERLKVWLTETPVS